MNKELLKSLTATLGSEELALKAIEAMKDQEGEGEAVITLPANFNEIAEKAVKKAMEEVKVAQKKFDFTGSPVDAVKLSKAEKKFEANQFIKFIAYGQTSKAMKLKSVNERYLKLGAKTLDSQTTNTAGVLVPEIFETTIFSNLQTHSQIIDNARVLDYSGPGDVVNLRQLDASLIVYEVAELGKSTASTPSYSSPDITFTKYVAEVVMSEELLEDTDADLMGNLSAQASSKFAEKIQDRLLNRATSGQLGVLQHTGVTVVTISNRGSYLNATFSDIAKMSAALYAYNADEGANAKTYMNSSTWFDGILNNTVTAGSPFSNYAVNPFDGVPQRAGGKPVVLANQIATPTVSGSKFMIHGDLSKHLIVARKRGMRMKINTTGTASDGTNLNTQDARQLVISTRIGHGIVLPAGIVVAVT